PRAPLLPAGHLRSPAPPLSIVFSPGKQGRKQGPPLLASARLVQSLGPHSAAHCPPTGQNRLVWRIPSQSLNRPERNILVFVQQRPEGPSIKREIRAGDTGEGAPWGQMGDAQESLMDPTPPYGACNCLWVFHSPGLLRPPEVSEISQPQSVTAGEEITLSCRMTGHFPEALSVTWLRRGRGAGAPGAPRTQDGKSFQQETRLSFTPSVQRDQGAEYVCRVGHVALQTPLERRSRELQVTGEPALQGPSSQGVWNDPQPRARELLGAGPISEFCVCAAPGARGPAPWLGSQHHRNTPNTQHG
uniref:Ig-like domain-containing protein n=1 Tax=Chrysemys picta bellii TaxID=8478 RepID=A0A8C3H5Y3_CHRPI